MRTLGNITRKIRSKNAGPFSLTIDIFCFNKKGYNEVRTILSPKMISEIYKISQDDISIFFIPKLQIIKITFPRPEIQGSCFDRDLHGASFSIILEELLLQ